MFGKAAYAIKSDAKVERDVGESKFKIELDK
jgi:hypothetical protein